jgi:sigma-B regulation protein RsbU (phosphoserine phosphatase)
MEKELQMAREIQTALLPHEMPRIPGYEVTALWKAARETAGDFYDAFALGDAQFGVVIADVSDKGAGAALFMAVARTMIRSNAHVGLPPVEIISRTNDLILEDAEAGMFVTIFHSHFHSDGRSLHVNAGHNPPLYYHHESRVLDRMPRGGRAVGWFPDNPLNELEINMSPGDVIIYYTDGITEAENTQGEAYGEDRLADVSMANIEAAAPDLLRAIVVDVERFCAGAPPFDDMTIVIVRYVGL